MAKVGKFLVCLLIIAMDVFAGILGMQAEVAQNKVKNLRLAIFECRQPSKNAFMLGLAAATILALAHVIANILGCWNCICSKGDLLTSSFKQQIALVCLALSWIALAIGMSVLVIGALSNQKSRASCGLSHHHFFSIGAFVCFVHGLFSVAFYVSAAFGVSDFFCCFRRS